MTELSPLMPEGYGPIPDDEHPDFFGRRAGPFYCKRAPNEAGKEMLWFGLVIEERHTNGHRRGHGGLVMTLADEALGAAAWEAAYDHPSVTIGLQVNFIGAVREGALVECCADTAERTRNMVFVQGRVWADGKVVANASGTWKLLDLSKY